MTPDAHNAPPRSLQGRVVALAALALLSVIGAWGPAHAAAPGHRVGPTPDHAWVGLPALPAAANPERRPLPESRAPDDHSPTAPGADADAARRSAGAGDHRARAHPMGPRRRPSARAPPA